MSDAVAPTWRQRVAARFARTLVAGLGARDRVWTTRAARLTANVAAMAHYRREVADAHVRALLPDSTPAERHAIYEAALHHFTRELFEAWARPGDVDPSTVAIAGFEHLAQAHAQGHGVLLLSAHYGGWERVGQAVIARGLPLDVVVQVQRNPLINAWLRERREASGMGVIERGTGIREVFRSLKAGHIVAMLADQDGGADGLTLPWGNRNAHWYRGPAEVAFIARVPTVVGLATRTAHGYECTATAPYGPPADRSDAALGAWMRHYVDALTEVVRAHPEQYLWFHRRYKSMKNVE